MATAEVAGPFKVESAPHTIAAKVIPPEEVPTAAAKETVRIKIAVGLAIVVIVIAAIAVGLAIVVIVIAALAKRRKKEQPGGESKD